MPTLLHDENFVDDQILLRLLLKVHLLDRDRCVRADLISGVDATRGSARHKLTLNQCPPPTRKGNQVKKGNEKRTPAQS
jgi:hypothetical protein